MTYLADISPSDVGFGRLDVPQLRSLIPERYLLKALRNEANLPVRKQWHSPGILNQGNKPHCVAFAAKKLLLSGPVTNRFPWKSEEALYHILQKNDEWPGEDYDGTSVRAAMKVMTAAGLFSGYNWAFDHGTALKHGLLTGPMDWGTNWYEGMMQVDEFGFIRVKGKSVGGHSYVSPLVDRGKYDPVTKEYGAWSIDNSWGLKFGLPKRPGKAWITFADMKILIEDYGEAALGIEKKASFNFNVGA